MLLHVADGGWALFGPLGLADRYRFGLCRKVGRGDRRVGFFMLNPSTATHEDTDPTITRCVGYAKAWGFGWLEVGNLFGWRATDPDELRKATDPVEPFGSGLNDGALKTMAMRCDLIICAWGGKGELAERGPFVRRLIEATGKVPHALRVSKKTGQPWHPLYLPKLLTPQPWVP